jgi:UDP-N-acetylmuramoylalanine-D-glutamate ligase
VRTLGDAALAIETGASADRLAAFDVVIKSPGISAYRPELLAAAQRGTRFVGGTALWFAERLDEVDGEVALLIDQAVAEAMEAPKPTAADLETDVYISY